MKEPDRSKLKPCSEQFWEAFAIGGGQELECGFCKRIHVAMGELEEDAEFHFRKLAAAKPDNWVLDEESHSISHIEIQGRIIPYGCPCGRAQMYEEFIVSHAREITEFLSNKWNVEFIEAETNHRRGTALARDYSSWKEAGRREEEIALQVAEELTPKESAPAPDFGDFEGFYPGSVGPAAPFQVSGRKR